MKLSKNLGRVATAFLATAMLASLTAVPAFAYEAEDLTGAGQFNGDTFTISKHLQLADDTFTPNHTYNFTITPANADDAEEANGIEDGVAGAVDSTASVTFETTDNKNDNNVVTKSTGNIKVSLGEGKIDHAGVFKYAVEEVTEGEGIYDDVKYDTNDLVLYVHVINNKETDTGLEVDFVELVDPDASESKKIDGFTNEYGVDGEGKDKLYNVDLTKVVSGDGANMNAEFGFSVKVDSEYGNSKYLVIDNNGNAQPDHDQGEHADQWIELKNGEAYTALKLGNGDHAFIVGLTNGDSYTINETDPGKGYVTTAMNGSKAVTFDEGTLQFTGSGLTDNTTITYTNTKKVVTPTGIVMNVAPYALLVVVAAAGCFVFLRKRRED